MRLLYELSWLWEMMGIAMAAAVVCVACAALIYKAAKKKLSRKVIAVVAAAAFVCDSILESNSLTFSVEWGMLIFTL